MGHDGTAAWLKAIGETHGVAADDIAAAQNAVLPAIKGALAATPINGTITLSGYEGSELLVIEQKNTGDENRYQKRAGKLLVSCKAGLTQHPYTSTYKQC